MHIFYKNYFSSQVEKVSRMILFFLDVVKILTSIVFPRALPPPFRRIDFYCPPRPSLKPLKKEPFASYIYIEKGRPFWLLFASFFRLWKNVRAKSEAFRRVPQSSSCRILV